jgi:hypothetical protein
VLLLDTAWSDYWIGGVGSAVSEVGSWAVFISTVFAALALFMVEKAPWPSLLLLIALGWELQVSHASPHGPIAFGLLAVSAASIWWTDRHPRRGPLRHVTRLPLAF